MKNNLSKRGCKVFILSALLCLFASNAMAQSHQVTIKVNKKPTGTISGADTVCPERPIIYTVATANGDTLDVGGWVVAQGDSITPDDATIAPGASITGATITFYNNTNAIKDVVVKAYLVNATGTCYDSVMYRVAVTPRPDIDISGLTTIAEYCAGSLNTRTVSATNASGGATFTSWEVKSINPGIGGVVVNNSATDGTIYFTNTSNATGTVRVILRYTSDCGPYADSMDVQVRAYPAINISPVITASIPVCSERPTAFAINGIAAVGGAFTNWTTKIVPAGLVATITDATSASTNMTFNNTTQTDLSMYVYANYSDSVSCLYQDSSLVVVAARPNMDIVGSATVCPNVPIPYTTINEFGATFTSWTVVPVSAASSITPATGIHNTTGITYVNTTNAVVTATLVLTYTDTSSNDCGTYQDSLTVSIDPIPTSGIVVTGLGAGNEICSGDTATFTANLTNATLTNWEILNRPLPTGVTATFITDSLASPVRIRFTDTTDTQQTVSVKLTYTGSGNCVGQTYDTTIVVTVNPAIRAATLTVDNNEYCIPSAETGQEVIVTIAVKGGTETFSVDWSSSPVGVDPASGNIPAAERVGNATSNTFTVTVPADNINYTITIDRVTDNKGCIWIKP